MNLVRACLLIVSCTFVSGCHNYSLNAESDAASRWLATDITQYRQATSSVGQLSTQVPMDVRLAHSDLSLFAQVFDRVRTLYVHEVDKESLLLAAAEGMRKSVPDPRNVSNRVLVDSAIQGMLASLDPYSSYLDAAHWRALRDQTSGEFGGIGIQVRMGQGYIEVISPIDGTPAAAAGVQPGDHILSADGKSFAKMALRDAVLILRGRPGSIVKLAIKRQKLPRFNLSIERAIIKVASVRVSLKKNIGYIRVSRFSDRTGAEVQAAISTIWDNLGNSLKGFVLDLRRNPGGLFDQSIEVADLFLDKGRIVSTRARSSDFHYRATKGDFSRGRPLVVLIDKGSASAAEIVAGALKDNLRATLIGSRTFGKGSVQTILPLSAEDRLKLTTSIYLTPSGRTVEGGITPHIEVLSGKKEKTDAQLKHALDWLRRR